MQTQTYHKWSIGFKLNIFLHKITSHYFVCVCVCVCACACACVCLNRENQEQKAHCNS